jgi:hypothetical protein
MPEPIATVAVAFIEFTMVRHWFLSLAAILAFTLWASILDATPDIGKTSDFEFGFKHPFVTFALFPFILVYGIFCAIADALGIGAAETKPRLVGGAPPCAASTPRTSG